MQFPDAETHTNAAGASASPPLSEKLEKRHTRYLQIFASLDESLRRPVELIQNSAAIKIVAALVAGFTIYQLLVDLDDRRGERLERDEARVERAWARIFAPYGGDTGKAEALSFLAQRGRIISGTDLGCETTGAWDRDKSDCVVSPIYTGLDLAVFRIALGSQQPEDKGITPGFPNLQGSTLLRAQADNFLYFGDNFDGAIFENSSLRRSQFVFSSGPPILLHNDIRGSTLLFSRTPQLERNNLTDATLSFDQIFTANEIDIHIDQSNWAWADRPPKVQFQIIDPNKTDPQILSEAVPFGVTLCDPIDRLYDLSASYAQKVELWPDLDYKKRPAVTQSDIKAIANGSVIPPCKSMDRVEAARRWPEKYY